MYIPAAVLGIIAPWALFGLLRDKFPSIVHGILLVAMLAAFFGTMAFFINPTVAITFAIFCATWYGVRIWRFYH